MVVKDTVSGKLINAGSLSRQLGLPSHFATFTNKIDTSADPVVVPYSSRPLVSMHMILCLYTSGTASKYSILSSSVHSSNERGFSDC